VARSGSAAGGRRSAVRVSGDGVTLNVLVEGTGTPVLLLHGFPDSSRLWRHQIPVIAEAGFRAVVPDLRGYGESDRPPAVEDYAMARSIADMLALLEALEVERAHVVGHDWGAGLAWAMAALVPERVERLVVMSVGHPNTLRAPSRTQREKAWYQLLFQFEDVAEALIQRDDWKLFREMLGDAKDVERYIADLSRPGALTAALNWYRANASPAQELERVRQFPPVAAPTLGIWSTGDNFLLEEGMAASGEHVTGTWRYELIEDAGHWLQLDAPERVNELLLDFLA
jgi:pimeloyl-ACP methyl ester carboxylesterase